MALAALAPSHKHTPRSPQSPLTTHNHPQNQPLQAAERVQKQGGLYANFASEQSLSYLNGSLPGDYGFDPLGMSDPEGAGGFVTPEWLAYSEVIHGRWAMLGAAGCIAPEVLSAMGAIPQTGDEAIWFKSGVIPPAGSYDKYWVDPYTLFFVEVVMMQFAELKRYQDFRYPGSQKEQYFLGMENAFGGSGNPAYPGGQFFNMFNLGKTEADMNTLRLKEIKNGRLAMLAMFGYGAQATITQEGPFKNLCDHLADPVHHNMLTNFATAMKH
jgi:light-harvesting complex I chlorophyll a/b binding protein 3